MKRPTVPRGLTEGITRLARAVRKRSAGRGEAPGESFVLARPSPALAADEVLIAVADASSVALQRVKIPGPPSGTAPGAGSSKVSEIARRIAEIELIASELARPGAGPTPPAALTDAE